MNFKSYLLLLPYFLLQHLATEVDGMDLHDLSSIETIIDNVRERAGSYYQVEIATSTNDKKKDIIEVIFYDLSNILTKFNNMSADSRKVFSSSSLVSFISTFEKLYRKNGSPLNPKLSDKLTKIFKISETINSYVESLLQLGIDNISYDQDMLQFCPNNANAGQNVQFAYEKPIILKEYRVFVEILTAEIKVSISKESLNLMKTSNNRKSPAMMIQSEIIEYNCDSLSDIMHKNKFNTCGLTTSLNEAVFDYFHHVIATYLKEYVMLYFIDIIDARCLGWKAAPLLSFRENETLTELKENIKLTKELLAKSNYNIHNCDADYTNTISKPYYELEDMFDTIIISEKDLTTKAECSHNCELKIIGYNLKHDQCQKYVSCKYIGDTIDFCRVPDQWSSNRYQWIKGDDATYGSGYPNCNGTMQKVSSSYSWWPPFRFCDFCLCTCHKKPNSAVKTTPAISFREAVTNIEDDMVIVGIRFVEKNKLIHIQVKERKLRPRSLKDKASWKKLEDIYHNISLKEYRIKNIDSSFSPLKETVDYGWLEKMNLDDLIAPKEHVITGVRLRPANATIQNIFLWTTGSIQLQIRVTPFNYTKGVLVNKNKTRWIVMSDFFQKKMLSLDNPDKPTRSPGNMIDSTPDHYVRFQSSDLRKDAGLSTVPFFDAQDVEGDPEFPLGGVGLVHRGHEGYGGFLALKIYDLNLSQYFKDNSKAAL